MAVGTAAALLPIKSITRKSTSDKFIYQNGADQPGPCTLKLSETIKGIQKGKIEDTFGWCVKVEETKLPVDVQVNGDESIKEPKLDVAMVDVDAKVDDAKAHEEPQVEAKTNGIAVVDAPTVEEQPRVNEKVDEVVPVDAPKPVEEAKIEEAKIEDVTIEDSKIEEVKIEEAKIEEETDGYVRVKEPAVIEKLNGYVRVEESSVDELLEVQ